jgi:polyphenol oxidase
VTEKLVECSDPNRDFLCLPPSQIPIVDFMSEAEVMHICRTTHLLDVEYQEKYMEVVEKMRGAG